MVAYTLFGHGSNETSEKDKPPEPVLYFCTAPHTIHGSESWSRGFTLQGMEGLFNRRVVVQVNLEKIATEGFIVFSVLVYMLDYTKKIRQLKTSQKIFYSQKT